MADRKSQHAGSCEIGETLLEVFVAQVNSDQTEGRGGMKDVALYDNHQEAYRRIRGEGVMGVGDGDVVKRTFVHCGRTASVCNQILQYDHQIYNGSTYGRKPGENGWVKAYDPRSNDPDYAAYLKLKEKFEKGS